jgi:uncharacterized protein
MKRFLTLFAGLMMIATVEGQMPVPPKPALAQGLVIDLTGTLSFSQQRALNDKLIAYDDSTSNQIAIVIIPSLKGNPDSSLVYPIEDIALRILREWGVGGQANKDNGIVILVAKQDRQLRIETGYGLEGAIPDMVAASIIDHEIVPYFKRNDYYGGLDAGVDAIMKAAAGEYTAPENYADRKGKGKGISMGKIIFLLILLFFIFGGMGGGRKGGGMVSRRGYRGWLGPTLGGGIFGSGGGWSGGGGGGWSGGGGGGFGGFGGGSGGGGGASGSW